MSAPRSAIVVGGGLVGLLTAAELLQRGLHVTVLDSGEFARQASWAGGGILSPLAPWQEPEAITKLTALSVPRTQTWVEQFTADHGPDCELWTCGMRIMSPPQEAIQWAKRTRTTVVQEQSSLFLPDVAQLRTPRYGRAVVAWLDAHGADLCTQASARMVDGQKVVLENGDVLEADTVCLSAGAWSSDLLLHSPSRNWVRPIKGQMLAYAPDESSPDAILRLGPHYLIPRKDGRILVGSTLEDVGYDTTPTAEARKALESAAVRMWPALRERAVEHHWSGLRPLSASQQPLIGLHQPSGVWINAGHYRNGVTLAAGSAELLAASIMGDQTPVWAEDFKPPDCLA